MIAYPLGSMPELVRHGRTGFLVDDVDGAVEAVARIDTLSPPGLPRRRRAALHRARMVADYAELFSRVVAGGPSAVSR